MSAPVSLARRGIAGVASGVVGRHDAHFGRGGRRGLEESQGKLADLHQTPLLVVHGKADAFCSPELAAALHEQATGDKEIVWLDSALHIDLYDTEPYVGQAVDAVARFFARSL